MLLRNLLNAVSVLLIAYLLFSYTNRDGVELPRPAQGYYYVTNETQNLLAEAKREAARVLAAQSAVKELGTSTVAGALAQRGVALKEGDEHLAATIEYVHRYPKFVADSRRRRRRQAEADATTAAAAAAPFSASSQRNPSLADEDYPPVPVHVFLAADNGSYSGMHELFYITAAMRYSTRLEIEGCRSALFGFLEKPIRDPLTGAVGHQQRTGDAAAAGGLRKIPVLAVTTGIYVTSAAACTAAVMEQPMFSVQSVTLIGTAGVSPVVGGGGWNPRVPTATASGVSPELSEVASNPACQRPWAPASVKVAIGSVCVTYGSLMQECGTCEEEEDITTLCSRSRCSRHNATNIFGPCALRHPVSSFAEQMKSAMYGKVFPSPSATVVEAMHMFWEANEAATDYVAGAEIGRGPSGRRTRPRTAADGVEPADASDVILAYNRRPPTVPILLNCAEVTTNQILAGPRSDALCRQYTEELFQGLYDAKDLSCVQAMEGVGVLHVMTHRYPSIPVAIVRGASNYDMYPLSRHIYHLDKTPRHAARAGEDAEVEGQGQWFVAWDQKEHYLSDQDFHRYTRASYQYSIETASAVVLNYFLSPETVLPGM